ncbi:hypothetical protein BDK51DRAFT_45705 [Blyttiomyces helicus]|uniref:Uncharacterized protein n=1 Tax=Blyttiomyces helicus TaxID=388810 RepID=A0A4P9WIX6_9FUNG|nr:hypothetical protein BDK51DRAFT_45705 [Blyttiomyces helicus]|eukprot:RKO91408.1 hypothetical protein BDK51DRAFT_45705 [Blyttiomyces helicus]
MTKKATPPEPLSPLPWPLLASIPSQSILSQSTWSHLGVYSGLHQQIIGMATPSTSSGRSWPNSPQPGYGGGLGIFRIPQGTYVFSQLRQQMAANQLINMQLQQQMQEAMKKQREAQQLIVPCCSSGHGRGAQPLLLFTKLILPGKTIKWPVKDAKDFLPPSYKVQPFPDWPEIIEQLQKKAKNNLRTQALPLAKRDHHEFSVDACGTPVKWIILPKHSASKTVLPPKGECSRFTCSCNLPKVNNPTPSPAPGPATAQAAGSAG